MPAANTEPALKLSPGLRCREKSTDRSTEMGKRRPAEIRESLKASQVSLKESASERGIKRNVHGPLNVETPLLHTRLTECRVYANFPLDERSEIKWREKQGYDVINDVKNSPGE